MEAVKLTKVQIRDLLAILGEEPLENYEFLWVLESCLETPSSSVYGLGTMPWPAGLMITHRDCVWLRVDNEMLLTALLTPLPEQDFYRFYTTSATTLDMLQRWFPQGQCSQSRLCVRNLTKTWRKRFAVSTYVELDISAFGRETYIVVDGNDNLVADCTVEEVVQPWHEILQWSLVGEQDLNHWTEQVFGAITATLLAEGSPIVVRSDNDDFFTILQGLGYREFNQLYYYVAARS